MHDLQQARPGGQLFTGYLVEIGVPLIGSDQVEVLIPNRNAVDPIVECTRNRARWLILAGDHVCRRLLVADALLSYALYDVKHIITQLYPHPDVDKSRYRLLISA